jgi:CubicO group peptidase (beta-lactamase class C family)
MRCIYPLIFAIIFFGCNRNPGKIPEEKIEYVVNKAYENGDFIGSILVANKGEVIYQHNFGMCDAENKVFINDSTKFLIASLSKPITAILILRLKDQGKINLDDEVGKFLNVTNNTASKVTIHQLLTHTSGIEELISENHELEETDLTQAKFNFEPGSAFRYSNTGYVILKEIAEKVSDKSYEELIEQEICGPTQMKSTGVASNLDLVNNLAIGYGTTDQITPVEIGYSLKIVDGAGSIYSTVSDLLAR